MDITRDLSLLQVKAREIHCENSVRWVEFTPVEGFQISLAVHALNPAFTDIYFVHLERVFVDVCSRWLYPEHTKTNQCFSPWEIVAALGRIVPFAPYLSQYAAEYLCKISPKDGTLDFQNLIDSEIKAHGKHDAEKKYIELLLGIFRLVVFDLKTFGPFVQPALLMKSLDSTSITVRYLAARLLCHCIRAADAATEKIVHRYVGDAAISGLWEGKNIDYTFFSLWEERRHGDMEQNLQQARLVRQNSLKPATQPRILQPAHFSNLTVLIGGVLLPIPLSLDIKPEPGENPITLSRRRRLLVEEKSPFVPTLVTSANLRSMAEGILSCQPLLLTGPSGSGKSALVSHFARLLEAKNNMVILHLNSQSDAKSLLGAYVSHIRGPRIGTMEWRSGVLTNAVEKGYWVCIEDIDRAPQEVLSLLLPLIERRELLIPGRGETISASRNFKLIGTIRTSPNLSSHDHSWKSKMLGARLWCEIPIHPLPTEQMEDVICHWYPCLKPYAPMLVAVYKSARKCLRASNFGQAQPRIINFRDLEKWCERICDLYEEGVGFSAANWDRVFLDAIECFAGHLPQEAVQSTISPAIGQGLNMHPDQYGFVLNHRQIKLDLDTDLRLRVGTIEMVRRVNRNARIGAQAMRFASNAHTLRLMERVSAAVTNREPVLLVGETGIGKTYSVQYLAELLGCTLFTFNLSQQAEGDDLIGGMKPVSVKAKIMPLNNQFEKLFHTTFSETDNLDFLNLLHKAIRSQKWRKVFKFWRAVLSQVKKHEDEHPRKRKRTSQSNTSSGRSRTPEYKGWRQFEREIDDLESLVDDGTASMIFEYVEGKLVEAVKSGFWVLLDEVNLAPPATLEAIADLLPNGPTETPFLTLTEPGAFKNRVKADDEFRLFAAMNPSTDIGKSDLPLGIRSRFTELYVGSPDADKASIRSIVNCYIRTTPAMAETVTQLYLKIQELAKANRLVDATNKLRHFSLRSLTRALTYASELASSNDMRRSLHEGFCMAFTTMLNKSSRSMLESEIGTRLSVSRQEIGQPLKKPPRKPNAHDWINVERFWIDGNRFISAEDPTYILTDCVKENLNSLARAASAGKYPILLQGPTSAGKTSLIRYLANKTGNIFVRINNHEHTDIQEYLGSYVSTPGGKLEFQDGVLVQAIRNGYWIVLDELNLAPTDVLEALNRLLDDNRELLIPETQEVVRPHPNFMLFATQNPSGLYSGRKELSRAFRNRFLELHFDDLPVPELEEILVQQNLIAPSWCKKIAEVYSKLSEQRQTTRLFELHSFATLRDVFRWARRLQTFNATTKEEVALHGFMLLGERVRDSEQRDQVKEIIETCINDNPQSPSVRIDESYSAMASDPAFAALRSRTSLVWTSQFQRLFILVERALRNNEPVLLVGETGTGKTSVCHLVADAFRRQLYTLNAHQNTETADILGSQRPLRNRAEMERQLRDAIVHALRCADPEVEIPLTLDSLLLKYDLVPKGGYEPVAPDSRYGRILRSEDHHIQLLRNRLKQLFHWQDGILVQAMKQGKHFLLDEISLAEDAVLERLNSVLEDSRSLVLAEKGSGESIVASEGFQFLATMNPGGDYGKKELSPALRNRFTEIWVPPIDSKDDLVDIVKAQIGSCRKDYAEPMVEFAQWFQQNCNTSASSSVSIRDIKAWMDFMYEATRDGSLDDDQAFVQGALMVYVDTLGVTSTLKIQQTVQERETIRQLCLEKLSSLIEDNAFELDFPNPPLHEAEDHLRIGPFKLNRELRIRPKPTKFCFDTPTTRNNLLRLFRALQLNKPVLIEGSPGVGKTSLVVALAHKLGRPIHRINLSEQTDLLDLFGSDVPLEGAAVGLFDWRPAPFLTAMNEGHWVLLDEMNLASQSVLEGLNACLDHRGTATIPELGQTFHRHPDFRVFATQNPSHSGGDRKGLPASFVNRFTLIYADEYRQADQLQICLQDYPSIPQDRIAPIITLLNYLKMDMTAFESFHPSWDFNLRDAQRWFQLASSSDGLLLHGNPYDFYEIVLQQRLRTQRDKCVVNNAFRHIFNKLADHRSLFHNLSPDKFSVGLASLSRDSFIAEVEPPKTDIRSSRLAALESMIIGVQKRFPVLLVGESGAGKTALIQSLAAISGAHLVTFQLSSDIDASDLVGSYEQADVNLDRVPFLNKFWEVANKLVSRFLCQDASYAIEFLGNLHSVRTATPMFEMPVQQVDAAIDALQSVVHSDICTSEVAMLLQEGQQVKYQMLNISGPRFKWVDSALVKALERGDWIVLDNANLCKAAVLDRLNSLLEPNGELVITEQPLSDGTVRIVRPHKNFRLFLTMDPKNGELSKAMHNRVMELFVPKLQPSASCEPFWLESSMYRFRNYMRQYAMATIGSEELGTTIADHLALPDTELAKRFSSQIRKGLLPADTKVHEVTKAIGALYFISDVATKLDLGSKRAENTPVHPLNNEIIIRAGSSYAPEALLRAALYELMLQLWEMEHAFECVLAEASDEIPSNALLRSVAAARKPNADRENSHLARFLLAFKDTTKEHVHALVGLHDIEQAAFVYFDRAVAFWWGVLRLSNSQDFDDSIKQAVIELGREELAKGKIKSFQESSVVNRHLVLIEEFAAPIKRSTGQAMELLWQHLRPQTVPTVDRLNMLLQLEKLADLFDAIPLTSHIPFVRFCLVREAFGKAISVAIAEDIDVTALLLELEGTLNSIHPEIDDSTAEPFFKEQFSLLWNILDIQNLVDCGRQDPNLRQLQQFSALLARRPTKWDHLVFTNARDFTIQSVVARLASGSSGAEMHSVNAGSVLMSTDDRLNSAVEVPLSALDLFREEVSTLAQTLSLGAPVICGDLAGCLWSILRSVWENLRSNVSLDLSSYEGREVLSQLIETIDSSISEPSLEQQSNKEDIISRAYIAFGLLLVLLYVPDKVFDPAIKRGVTRTLWRWEKEGLKKKLDGLLAFEDVFSGQSTSLRIRQIQSMLDALGSEPAVAAICRPEVSRLAILQGEFDNVLRAVRPMLKTDCVPNVDVIRANILQVMHRLRNNFRAYDDLIIPLVGFLQCLMIGIELRNSAEERAATDEVGLLGRLRLLRDAGFAGFSTNFPASQCHPDILVEFSIAQTVDTHLSANHSFQNITQAIFSQLYKTWRDIVAKEQEQNAKKSSLYVYRGAREDEEDADNDEFEDLFPTFDEGSEAKDKINRAQMSREMAIRIADVHASIYLKNSDPAESVLDTIRMQSPQSKRVRESPTDILPRLLLRLHDCQQSVSAQSPAARPYNFYKDSNVEEAMNLAGLVRRIRSKFAELQKQWPEHDTIAQVIRKCDDITALPYSEPVAQFLTKSEKLHETVHEWQKVTSREYSAANLFDELTKLIINWRRLELSTWLRLFDIEREQRIDDAKSWWFVAYENIIAVPESLLATGQSLTRHSEELLNTLQSFMRSTPMGEFLQRLTLLEQFLGQLQHQLGKEPQLQSLHSALLNFIRFYERFSVPVKEALTTGRQHLERDVKEVVQLASWKDTTIEALRQSAKSSHRKLFKVVRKYRQLLQTPVTSIIGNGIPELSLDRLATLSTSTLLLSSLPTTEAPALALEECKRRLSDWDSWRSRFKNDMNDIADLKKRCQRIESIETHNYIDNYLSDLSESMNRLQKETPSSLKEDTKDIVRHLKVQKRRLFADVLRDVGQMGVQYNLSQAVLSKQSSLATVLATGPALPDIESDAALQLADYNLHRTLDLMPQVRQILREHSGDLTAAEVSRSVGYLEGLLHQELEQRRSLHQHLTQYHALEYAARSLCELWSYAEDGLSPQPAKAFIQRDQFRRTTIWMPSVLKVFAKILQAQSSMGGIKASDLFDGLQQSVDKFHDLADSFRNLPTLPPPLLCNSHARVLVQCQAAFRTLQEDIRRWREEVPEFAPVLQQLELWTGPAKQNADAATGEADGYKDFPDFQDQLLETVDDVLNAIREVCKKRSKLPSSTKDAKWLVNSETGLLKLLEAFNVSTISNSLGAMVRHFGSLSPDALRVAAALSTVVAPIFQQYQVLVRDVLSEYSSLHVATCRLSFHLSKAFAHLGKEGFCTPPEPSNEKGAQGEKLEDGVGLGDGEGAEDISKDIGRDEDLTELAEDTRNGDRQDEVEDEPDAVDMADADLEGTMGEMADRGEDENANTEASGDEQDEMDEEVGDVDDLGPGAVDEKMWNDGEMAEKNKEVDKSKGTTQDEKAAAQPNGQSEEVEEDADQADQAESGAEESEEVTQLPLEKTDLHIQDGDNLDLPEDMNLEGEDHDDASDDLHEFDDINGNDATDMEASHDLDADEHDVTPEGVPEDVTSQRGDGESDEELGGNEITETGEKNVDSNTEMQDEDGLLGAKADDDTAAEDALPADRAGGLTAVEQRQGQDQDEATIATTQREEGDAGQSKDSASGAAGKSGSNVNGTQDAVGRDDGLEDSAEAQAFKKLGDTLERWYKQHRQIRQPKERPEGDQSTKRQDEELKDADFEHLPDDDTLADAQALGAAKQDQATALDTDNAIDVNDQEMAEEQLANGHQEEHMDNGDVEIADTESNHVAERHSDADGASRTFIGDQRPMTDQQQVDRENADSESDIEEVDERLSIVQLKENTDVDQSRDATRILWQKHASSTQPFSAMLTEQLRLILAPTLATRLRGDYRTGKRLNMKRIIPYIASGYKKDKIWMRRTVPTKRSYQLMIALDDSKSMAEGGSKELAFETLALISKALAMLEAGELCIVGFGENVQVHHAFDRPFSDEAGVNVFAGFKFDQRKTDVKKLVKSGIELFQDARMKASRSTAELWQLMLIISDGVCEDHEGITRLVRQAQELRIMIVFVVVDAAANAAIVNEKKGQSIMELQTAEFTGGEKGQMQLVRRRYMDTFPFRWWLVVGNVRELPGVLATALRQWFAEVAAASG